MRIETKTIPGHMNRLGADFDGGYDFFGPGAIIQNFDLAVGNRHLPVIAVCDLLAPDQSIATKNGRQPCSKQFVNASTPDGSMATLIN